jgi:hypothetical protein
MEHDLFISYSDRDRDLIENFRTHLADLGVSAWVYSRDRTLAKDSWEEIKEKIKTTKYMIFACSKNTEDAIGQQRELEIAMELIKSAKEIETIIPIVIDDSPFSIIPICISRWNGERLTPHNIKSIAFGIATQLFPYKFEDIRSSPWHYPIPGNWVEVSRIDEFVEQHLELKELLYFRQISPMGLFECYAPRRNSLIWVSPLNVRTPSVQPDEGDSSLEVPFEYSVGGWLSIQSAGWSAWRDTHPKE